MVHETKNNLSFNSCKFLSVIFLALFYIFLVISLSILHRVSTMYLHMAGMIGGGNLTKAETKTCWKDWIKYTVNTDPSPESDSHLEGNFLPLWKRWSFSRTPSLFWAGQKTISRDKKRYHGTKTDITGHIVFMSPCYRHRDYL